MMKPNLARQLSQPLLKFISKNPPAYTEGLAPYRDKDWQTAKDCFEQAILQRPDHAPSHFKLGMCFYKLNDYDHARACMKKAMKLDPSRSEWMKQIELVEKRIGTAENTKNKKIINKKDGKSKDELIKLMQLFLLHGSYDQFDRLSHDWNNMAGGKGTAIARQVKLLKAEAALMSGETLEEALLDIRDSYSDYIYYQAIHHSMTGDPGKAMELLRAQLLDSPQKPEYHYALIEAAALAGEIDIAFDMGGKGLTTSRRARTWSYLSAIVDSPSTLHRYLNMLEQWCEKSPDSRHHRDIAWATARACLQGGAGLLARKVMHDSILYHERRKGGPASVRPVTVVYSQDEHLPLWLNGFADLPYESTIKTGHRAVRAMIEVNQFFSESGLKVFLIQDTLIWSMHGFSAEKAPQAITLGVWGNDPVLEEIQAKINSDPRVQLIPQSSAEGLIACRHRSGIPVRLFVHTLASEAVTHQYAGAQWTNRSFEVIAQQWNQEIVYVPSDPQAYLRDFHGDGDIRQGFDWVMQSRNAQVINEDQLVCYAYEKLLTAKIFGDVDLEGAAMRTLLDLGEHQAEYQQVLTGRFVIPDLERIRRDAPKVVLYVSGLEKVGYQANMWIPVLERLSVKSAIVIREKHIAEELIPTVLPIYFMRTMRDVENLEQANVRTILYPANTQKNIHTLRFYRMNHYFINHGESDKVVNQSKFLMAYDKLLVGGEMAERRLKDANLPLREGQVVHVGRPQAELMLEKLDQPTKKLKLCCMLQPGKGLLRKPITHP